MNVYEIVTKKIVELLEQGVAPWRKPWNANSAPRNLVSNRRYRGINVFLLVAQGYGSPYWLTFKQAKDRGGSIRKGEKGTIVVFYKLIERTDQDGEKYTVPLLRYYRVWNLDQTVDVTVPKRDEDSDGVVGEENIDAELIVKGYKDGPTVSENGGDKAYYQPSTDRIALPKRNSFDTMDNWYATLFHELGHSTGHKDRLNRPVGKFVFGSHDYGREELVAEMTSAFLTATSGIESTLPQNASYLDNWIKAIKEDGKAVVWAASQANKAADYILGKDAELSEYAS